MSAQISLIDQVKPLFVTNIKFEFLIQIKPKNKKCKKQTNKERKKVAIFAQMYCV